MIQFNLLPDVKLQYIKTQRTKHVVMLFSFISSVAAVGLLVFLLTVVYVVQPQREGAIEKKINKTQADIKSVKDVTKMITVQNQLNTLTGLHVGKPVTSRAFGYLQQLTPASANLNKFEIDYVTSKIVVAGDAPKLEQVNIYTDALKNVYFVVDGKSDKQTKAFKDVVLKSIARDNEKATFEIEMSFDPMLFNIEHAIALRVGAGINSSSSESPFQGGEQQ